VPVNRPVGLLAEFADADDLVRAVRELRAAGFEQLEAFSPYPLPEAAEALGYSRAAVPAVMFIGGLVGGCAAFFMQYWTMGLNYPLNIGGRPLNSWPAFIPITFELTILTSALCGFLGLIAMCGLPRYHHPLFNVDRFNSASRDRFFLFIKAADPAFDSTALSELLKRLDPIGLEEVPE